MKYFKTKHEKNSAKLTTLITVILLLLLFVVGAPYMDPPIEYGVAVNFGTSDFGKGDVQPLEPIKSEPKEINEPYQPEVSKAEPTKASEAKEEVLTQDNEEAIAIKKQKQAEANAKAISDAKAKAEAKVEADRIAKEKQEQEDKKKKLDALIGGVSKSEGKATGGEGNDNKVGDKGQPGGDPNADGYYRNSGTEYGGDYQLGDRNPINKPKPKYTGNEEGFVVVSIEVDANGKVTKATPGVKGSTTTATSLLTEAKEAALKTTWEPSKDGTTRQVGVIKYRFSLSQ